MGQRGTGFPGTERPAFSGGLRERESRGCVDREGSRDDADPEDLQDACARPHDQDRRVLHGRSTVAAGQNDGRLRRGTLEVTASNSTIIQELTFQKQQILTQLQAALPDARIRDIRFRVGSIL